MGEGTRDGSWQQPQHEPDASGEQPRWSQPGAPVPPAPAPAQPPGAPGGAPRWSPPGSAPPPGAWGAPPAARPGIVPLRPLGLGEIYDGAFRAFRLNPRVVVGMSAVVVAITTVLTLVPTTLLSSDLASVGTAASGRAVVEELSSAAARSVPGFLVAVVLQGVALTVLNGLLIVAISRAVLGERIGAGQLWRAARGRVAALVGLALLTALVYLLLVAVALGPGAALLATGRTGAGAVVLLLSCALALVAGAWLYVRWSLAAPALLLEGTGVLAALGRSARLVRGSFWRVLGITLLTAVITYAVVAAIALPFALVSGAVGAGAAVAGLDPAGFGTVLLQQAVAGVGSVVEGSVAYPFSASVTALLYIDLRMRREGLDVELHRAAARPPADRW